MTRVEMERAILSAITRDTEHQGAQIARELEAQGASPADVFEQVSAFMALREQQIREQWPSIAAQAMRQAEAFAQRPPA